MNQNISTLNQNIDSSKNLNSARLMIFELSAGGHYPEYLTHLINYWQQNDYGNLFLVISNQFSQKHPEVVELASDCISFIFITPQEEQSLPIANSTKKRIVRAFQEFELAAKYARKLQATEILFTYLDTRQIPLAVGKKLPCSCSGIYFRSRFHYGKLTKDKADWRENFLRWQEKLLLQLALKNAQLKYIFSLDPFAIKYFPTLPPGVQAIALPDPVAIDSNIVNNFLELKASLGIESQRKTFLLFGGLTRRKGILPLLDALHTLSPKLGQKICLLLVGSISKEFQQLIQPKIECARQVNAVQIISEYRYVSETETRQYFQLADFVLALYQRHVGMSGIILRAAAAHKPILSSNYGLMGEITRRYRLGLTVDSTKPQEIATGLRQLLTKSPEKFMDGDRAKQFVLQNSPSNFARTIFKHLHTAQ